MSRAATVRLFAAWALMAAVCAAPVLGADGGVPPTPSDLRRSMDAAVEFLAGRITVDGRVDGEFPIGNVRYGMRTALAARALLAARVDADAGPLKAALDWLDQAKLTGTVAVAERAQALAAVSGSRYMRRVVADAEWLVRTASPEGSYGDDPSAEGAGQADDVHSTQAAVLAAAAAATRGAYVSADYWIKPDEFLRARQQADGGWCYRPRAAMRTTGAYGSLTAAALAALYACQDRLPPSPLGRSALPPEDSTIAAAWGWLEANYDIRSNPRRGEHAYYQWLYALGQAAGAGGYKRIAGHDWYAEGAAQLLASQNADGSWGRGDRIADTAYAVLFLAGGGRPAAFSKLRYAGKWNPHPRDLSSLAGYLSNAFERPVGWRIVDADAPLEELCESPIIYISGSGPCQLTGGQIDKLRQFTLRGGVIFCEAATDNGDFALDMQGNLERMFPDRRPYALADDHVLRSLHFVPQQVPQMQAVSNGERLMALLSPRDVSGALQRGPDRDDLSCFQFLANLYLYATYKAQDARADASTDRIPPVSLRR